MISFTKMPESMMKLILIVICLNCNDTFSTFISTKSPRNTKQSTSLLKTLKRFQSLKLLYAYIKQHRSFRNILFPFAVNWKNYYHSFEALNKNLEIFILFLFQTMHQIPIHWMQCFSGAQEITNRHREKRHTRHKKN